MIIRQDGSQMPYEPTDFSVGQDITLCSRSIRIYDCDQYTREFFGNLGTPQGEAGSCPEDAFKVSTRPIPIKKDPELLEYLEKKLGGGRVASQKQFLDHDRKVLRFFTRELGGDLQYVWHYFLADDTCEIREVHFPNDGRDSFSIYLRRQRLPQTFDVNQPGQALIGDNYLTCDEISFEKPLCAYGREFKIFGVDKSTQDFYLAKFKLHFPLGDVEKPAARAPVVRQIPPHNGFGSEVDSLGYVFDLVPKKPKIDFFKYVDNDKKVLRYTAKFNTNVPEDVDRRFIISYYLADDTLSIFEPAQKNSGIIEGPFLERKKYKNIDNNMEFITPSELAIGGDIKVNGYCYTLLGCDDFSKKYLASHTYAA
jgi:EF-hand domain-containing protein 1